MADPNLNTVANVPKESNLADYSSLSASHDGGALGPNRSPNNSDDHRNDICADPKSGRARASKRIITVEIMVILFAACFGGLATLKGQYIRMRIAIDLSNGSNVTNTSQGGMCNGNSTSNLQDKIQKETAQLTLYLGMVSTFPGLFSTLIIGTLSEQYGRRLAILFPCIGLLIQTIVYLFIVYLHLPLGVFYLGDITGITGGLSLFMAGCFSYIADITSEKQRMIRIVIVELLIFVGISVLQLGLGYTIKYLGFGGSLWIPFAATTLCVINGATPCLLIETVDRSSQKGEQQTVKTVFRDIGHLLKVKTDNRQYILLSLLFVGLLTAIIIQGSISITVLYGQGQPFCWQSVTIGIYITTSLMITGLGCVVGAGIFSESCLNLRYLTVVQIANLSSLANILLVAFTNLLQSSKILFASSVLGIFKLLGVPLIRTFLSTIVEKKEHGALFASLGVVDQIAMFLAPIFLNGVYALTVDKLSTAVFYAMAGTIVVPVILVAILQWQGVDRKKEKDGRPLLINQEQEETQSLLS